MAFKNGIGTVLTVLKRHTITDSSIYNTRRPLVINVHSSQKTCVSWIWYSLTEIRATK